MTPANRVEISAARLRSAVSAGSHVEAEVQLEEYCRALQAQLVVLRPGDPAAVCMHRHALELIEWARRATIAARAHYSLQLAALPDLRRYSAPAKTPNTWTVLV